MRRTEGLQVFHCQTKIDIVIPKPHQLEVWDIDDIVKFIGNTMNKNEELALDVLQRKSITLIVIATMWRHGQTLVESNYKISIYPETNKDEAIGVSYS